MTPDIIFEDAFVLVCYKPAGIPTQTKRFGQQDMESILKNYRAKKKENPFIGVVHRLDQPVEGVMVFAKTKEATAELSRQVRERSVGKHYFAASEGNGTMEESGSLQDYIAFDQKTNVARIVSEEEAKKSDAKKALLDYRIVSLCGNRRVFDVTLHTGRHHQIRLQFANAGCPLIGDQKYGEGERGQQLALCSYKIEFVHPKTKKEMVFEIKPRNELLK